MEATGRRGAGTVLGDTGEGRHRVALPELGAGVYFVRGRSADASAGRKLVVAR